MGVEPTKGGLRVVGLRADQLILGLGHVKAAGDPFLETDTRAVQNAFGEIESALGLHALFKAGVVFGTGGAVFKGGRLGDLFEGGCSAVPGQLRLKHFFLPSEAGPNGDVHLNTHQLNGVPASFSEEVKGIALGVALVRVKCANAGHSCCFFVANAEFRELQVFGL